MNIAVSFHGINTHVTALGFFSAELGARGLTSGGSDSSKLLGSPEADLEARRELVPGAHWSLAPASVSLPGQRPISTQAPGGATELPKGGKCT